MRTSLNPLMYKVRSYSRLFEEAGTYELLLSPGTYYMALCGGGGAGGNKGANSYEENMAGGNGGAGGTATVVERTVQIPTAMRCLVYVGDGGRTAANGGNGGVGGGKGGGNAGAGGSGGGGGMPTYIQFAQQIDGDAYIVSDGGGGGGGGGGGSEGDRYAYGGGSGAGGGRYRLVDGAVVSDAGKNGVVGGTTTSGGHVDGRAGITGFAETENYRAGSGGTSNRGAGGTGGTGLGASGGSGGGGAYNSDSGWGNPGGAGGGGCGGTPTAGGGGGGTANGRNYNAPGGNATNYRTAPLSSTNYLGQTSNLGRGGVGQTSSQAATNGYNGWFYIVKFQPAAPFDMGNIDESVTRTIDCLEVTGTVDNTADMGNIA